MKRTAGLAVGVLLLVGHSRVGSTDDGGAGDATADTAVDAPVDAPTAPVDAPSDPASTDGPPKSCGDLFIVLDPSDSMANCRIDGTAKEAIAKKSLKDMIFASPAIGMGLFVCPDTLTGCGNNAACNTG